MQSPLLSQWYAMGVVALVYVLYHGLLVGAFAWTLGKRQERIRVICVDGTRCGYGRAIGRALLQVATLMPGVFLYWVTLSTAGHAPGQDDSQTVNYAAPIWIALSALLFLWIPYDRRRQGLHDQIAKTLVVKSEGSE
jgi:uncharacterized RDD family membrane protein YckC